ncbi:MAG: hypothetical protein M3328_02345, partial [Chloroflexota bacterium]|nr:hypothetical protein [Chloroflexota bacterium]
IWDVTNFIRTIPNGGLLVDQLDASMMVSPADIVPIRSTPLPIEPAPGNVPVVTPEGGLGQTGGATGENSTPQPNQTPGTNPTVGPVPERTVAPGG